MAAGSRRLARSDRVSKRLRGIKKGTGIKLKGAIHVLNVYALVPVQVNGFLVSMNKNFIVFRHKKTNASKKTRVSTFPRNSVIEVFGQVGEPSQVTMWRRNLISSVRGRVTLNNKQGSVTVIDLTSEEPTTIFLNDSIEIELFADEEEKAQRAPKKRKSRPVVEEEDESDEDDEDDSDEEDFEESDDEEEDEDEEDLD